MNLKYCSKTLKAILRSRREIVPANCLFIRDSFIFSNEWMGTVQKFKFIFSCGILEVFFVISDSFLILKYDAVHYFWDFKIWVKSVKLPKNIFTFQVSFILSFLSMFSIGSSKKCQSKLTLKATESVRMAQKNCQHYLF